MRKILFILSAQVFHYLLWAFGYLDFNFFEEIPRLMYIFTGAVSGLITFGFIEGWGDGCPAWLKTPTHEEKKSSIKKYIGELHEELSLYGEAVALTQKIREFKSKQ